MIDGFFTPDVSRAYARLPRKPLWSVSLGQKIIGQHLCNKAERTLAQEAI